MLDSFIPRLSLQYKKGPNLSLSPQSIICSLYRSVLFIMTLYYKMRQKLLQNVTTILLQNAIVLLQNVRVIANCDDVITNCDSYYKM